MCVSCFLKDLALDLLIHFLPMGGEEPWEPHVENGCVTLLA